MSTWSASRFVTGQPDRSTKVVATKNNIVATIGRQQSSCRPLLPRPMIAVLIAVMSLLLVSEVQAQREITIGEPKRTATIPVFIRNAEDVRTDTRFVKTDVGNAKIAGVNSSAGRLFSVLSKKSGTSRASVYAGGPTLTGMFDVEVRYDTAMLPADLSAHRC